MFTCTVLITVLIICLAALAPAPMPTATATPLTARRAAFTVDELQAEVWTRPLTAAQWVARDPDDIPHVGYNYRFGSDDLDAIKRCHDEHGFCIVESVLTDAEVASLREGVHRVMPAGDMDEGTSLVRHAFVEFCPEAQQLLLHDKAMAIQCKLLGVTPGVDDHEVTVHRSAAIVRTPGAGKGQASSPWHSDFTGHEPLPLTNASAHLNRGEAPNGKWYYLNGSHPRRGGLAIIAESHHPDYQPPPGWEWVGQRAHSGLRRISDSGSGAVGGESAGTHTDFDIPGCVPIYAEPNDLLIFAARTLHAAFPVPEDFPDVRHSVGVGLRSTHALQGIEGGVSECPWPIPSSARRLIDHCPTPGIERYLAGYWGFPGAEPGSPDWTPAAAAAAAAATEQAKL